MSTKKTKIHLLTALIFGAVLLFLSIIFAGGGHGEYWMLKIAFPYSMLLASIKQEISSVLTILMILQYPTYVYIVSKAKKKNKTIVILASLHVISVIIAIQLIGTF